MINFRVPYLAIKGRPLWLVRRNIFLLLSPNNSAVSITVKNLCPAMMAYPYFLPPRLVLIYCRKTLRIATTFSR